MRFELNDRVDTLRKEVIGHLEGQSGNLTTMVQQQVDLVAKLIEENKELNKEIERLRRF
jgi:regulator of replication initiation timing